MNIFKELRRRNVFRVAGVYAVVGWLLAQAASVLADPIMKPMYDARRKNLAAHPREQYGG